MWPVPLRNLNYGVYKCVILQFAFNLCKAYRDIIELHVYFYTVGYINFIITAEEK